MLLSIATAPHFCPHLLTEELPQIFAQPIHRGNEPEDASAPSSMTLASTPNGLTGENAPALAPCTMTKPMASVLIPNRLHLLSR
jgi:hypothetical protein